MTALKTSSFSVSKLFCIHILEMASKSSVKHACNVCNHEFRSDNLMRHVYTHRNELQAFMSKPSIQYCIDNKMPVMYPAEKDWIMCLICKKSAHINGRGMTIKDFIKTYNTTHSKCRDCFDTVKECYDAPENKIMEESKSVVVDSTELLELQEKYKELQKKMELVQKASDDTDDAFNKFMDKSDESIQKLTDKNSKLTDHMSNLINMIQLHITDPDTLKLFESQIYNCNTAMTSEDD